VVRIGGSASSSRSSSSTARRSHRVGVPPEKSTLVRRFLEDHARGTDPAGAQFARFDLYVAQSGGIILKKQKEGE